MFIRNANDNNPVHLSMKRMEMNLRKLKKIGPHGKESALWETAGHIWGAAYWVGELTKDPKIISHVYTIRLALRNLVAKQHEIDTDFSGFEHTVNKITECYKKIHERI